MEVKVQSMTFQLKNMHDNVIVKSTLEDLFDNFDEIPMADLQAFIDKYKKQ